MIDVTVYDGKYRYIFNHDGARALRYGEEWRDCTGDGFILALAQDLEEAREDRRRLAAVVMSICGNPKGVGESEQDQLYEFGLECFKKSKKGEK